MVAGNHRANVIPARETSLRLRITSSIEGALREACVEAGRGAAPAGLVRSRTPGRRRGSARVMPMPNAIPQRAGKRGTDGESAARRRQIVRKKHALKRMWRAERRPPRFPRIADAIGLRFRRAIPSCLALSKAARTHCHARASGYPVIRRGAERGERFYKSLLLDRPVEPGNDEGEKRGASAVTTMTQAHPILARGYKDSETSHVEENPDCACRDHRRLPDRRRAAAVRIPCRADGDHYGPAGDGVRS